MFHRARCGLAAAVSLVVLEVGLSALRADRKPGTRPPRKVTGWIERTYFEDDEEYKFAVFVPPSYKPDGDKPPVLLFLHGHGKEAVKDDGTEQDFWTPTRGVGTGWYIRNHKPDFGFITVFPQSQERWAADKPDCGRAIAMLEQVLKEFNCDRDKVYLTGYSQSGHGAWVIASMRPDLFAAMAVVAGFPHNKEGEIDFDPEEAANKIKDVPAKFWAARTDNVVPYLKTEKMVRLLTDAGADPVPESAIQDAEEYDELDKTKPGARVFPWFNSIYGDEALYNWLLDHSKNGE